MGVGPLARLAPLAFAGFTIPFRELLKADRERRQEIEAFTIGGGFKVSAGPRQQEWLMKAVKREMLRSPSFSALMFEIEADTQRPVDIKLGRSQKGFLVDEWGSDFQPGKGELDLDDLNALPIDPPAGYPNAITQGEILIHALAEARDGAQRMSGQDQDDFKASHHVAIAAQNVYRDERGQQGHRRVDNPGGRNSASNYNWPYDNGYSEVWVLKGDTTNEKIEAGVIDHIDRYNPPPDPRTP